MSDQPVTRLLIGDHELPGGFNTGHVEVRRITLAPDVAVGPHEHNGPVFGVIERGSVRFQVEDGQAVILRSGDVFYEPADTLIRQFDATSDGVEFLAWFPLRPGEAGTLIPRT